MDGEVFSVRIVSVGGGKAEVAAVTPQKTRRGDVAFIEHRVPATQRTVR